MQDPTYLLDRTLRPREAVAEARDWLLDLDWAGGEDDVEAIELANDVTIVAAVQRFYEGGWKAFAIAAGYWSGLTPREREANASAARRDDVLYGREPSGTPTEMLALRRLYGERESSLEDAVQAAFLRGEFDD